uniref:T9SS type A sorting domain-containing protein n=1 Tax=candidate division WOR-3 bacterium TaxID=2052148 RepID=A0A7C4TBZ1_UNCW3
MRYHIFKKIFPFIWGIFFVIGRLYGFGEFLLDTTYYPLCAGFGHKPAVAFDGTNFIAVWEQDGIWGTRVDQLGTVIDTSGFLISEIGHTPDIKFDGVNYLIVWEQDFNIYGTRISPQGVILDTVAFPISIASGEQASPRLAFNSTNYFVIWRDNRLGFSAIYGARVTPSGQVLDPNGIFITSLGDYASVASDSSNYMVVTVCPGWGTYCYKVSANGVVGPANYVSSYYLVPSLEISFDGVNYLVAWGEIGTMTIKGALVDTSGFCLNPNGFTIVNQSVNYSMKMAFDGTKHLIVWDGNDNYLHGVFVYPDNTVALLGPIYASEVNEFANLAYGNGEYFIAWERLGSANYPPPPVLMGTMVDTTGANIIPDGFFVILKPHAQSSPALSFNGSEYLCMWQEQENNDYNIRGIRVNQVGQIIAPVIRVAGSSSLDINPAITSNGMDYLCTWTQHYPWLTSELDTLMATRIDQSGAIIDTPRIRIVGGLSSYYYKPTQSAIAFDGNNYFIVWDSTQYSNSFFGNIWGTFISPAGSILQSVLIVGLGSRQISPALAFNSTKYLVAWRDNRYGWVNQYEVYGALVSPDGIILKDSIKISPFIPANDYLDPRPAVATDGDNYFVVCAYREYSGGQDNYNIYGTRVDSTGNILDPSGIPICTAQGTQGNPAVVFDGINYMVVWQDNRNGEYDIYGAKISRSGVIIDTFIVSNQEGDQIEPEIIRGNGDTLFIVYTGFTPEINGRPANTMRIWGKFYPFTSVEETVTRSVPDALCLEIYPNPFRNAVSIKFQIPEQGVASSQKSVVSIKIYDVTGRLVKDFSRFTSYDLRPTSIVWDGTDDSGHKLPSGVYFIKFTTEGFNVTQKIILLE